MSEPAERLHAALQGRYHIERELGEGGMATVYLAKDVKHNRNVALKVLKPELAAVVGAERFLAEIDTTASLQHPRILPLFDSGAADGFLFYVMPYVEGESLRQRLDRQKQLPVGEAVRIATAVANALDHAHRHGVIHRDIKPANILLQDGEPVVADFGIALAVGAAGGSRLTETGLSLGTLQYMSPEQATGDLHVGPATDIYALGCVLYEMLVGEPPYTGSTAPVVLGKILRGDPVSAAKIRASVPANVDAAIAQALAALPADRFATAQAFGEALAQPGFRWARPGEPTPLKADRRWRRLAIGGLIAASILLVLAGWGWLRSVEDSSRALVWGALEVPGYARVYPNAGFQLSPDGRALAYVARDADGVEKIWVQSLDARGAAPLEGTEGGWQPFWSFDGMHLGFFADGRLKRIPAAGGAVTVLASVSMDQPKGGTWSPHGRIVYVPDYRTGLFQIPAGGGEPEALTELDAGDGELSHRWPQFLPDGRTVLFLVQTDEYGAADDRSRIEVLEADGERREVMRVNSSAVYAPPGGLLYWREGSIYSSELDEQEWRVRGAGWLIAEDVGFNSSEWANFSVSSEGTLVYHAGTALPWRLEWRDRAGRVLSVEGSEGDYSSPELSSDGRHVAYREGIATLWVLDLLRGTRTRLTFEEGDHYSPTWSPDRRWIAYSSDKLDAPGADIYRRRSDGSGAREHLYDGGSRLIQDLTWSPDGRWIAFSMTDDIHLLDIESGETRIAVATPGTDEFPSFSPDGRWLAFSSDESGRYEVYVAAVAESSGRWSVSQRGGFAPQWSASGDELFFLGLDYELRVATVEGGPMPEFGVPEALFEISSPGTGHRFDVAPDGRILIRTHAAQTNAQNFRMILGWPELLAQPAR